MKAASLFLALFCFVAVGAKAQRLIRGHIYGGASATSPVDSMQIRTSSGNITYSSIDGAYQIDARPTNDTLFISYKGRSVIQYPVSYITAPEKFDIYLGNPAFYDNSYSHELEDVKIITRNYHTDSLQNRLLYGDVFDYSKPKFNPFHPITSVVNLFNQKYFKRQIRYREFAHVNEEQGYIDARFTRSYVASLTGIQNDSVLHDFMKKYRPSFAQIHNMVEIDLGKYILNSYQKYKAKNSLK